MMGRKLRLIEDASKEGNVTREIIIIGTRHTATLAFT
jgi:hypothetical protein